MRRVFSRARLVRKVARRSSRLRSNCFIEAKHQRLIPVAKLSKTMSDPCFNIKFVGEIEKRPELYNYTLPQYSKRDVTEKSWKEVGKKMNLSVFECKDRWKNLRSVFVRNLKTPPKVSRSKTRKPYYLMKAMLFALPFVKANKTPVPEGIPLNSKSVIEDVIDQEDGDLLENSGSSLQFDTEEQNSQLPQTSSSMDLLQQQSQSPTGQHQTSILTKEKSGAKRGISTTEVDSNFIDFLKAKTARLSAPNEEKTTAIKSFLDSLVPELEPLTEQQLKIFRRSIFRLIDEITEQTPQTTSVLS